MLNNNIPTLDLHGENREITRILVSDFISDCYKLKYTSALIIHGIGTGALKKEVHQILKNNKFVEKYYLDNFNSGCTIVTLHNFIDKSIRK